VERQIDQLEGVKESCVVGIKVGDQKNDIPIAFITKSSTETHITEDFVLKNVNLVVDYAIRRVYFLEALPKSMPFRKVLKHKLRELALEKFMFEK
jgi:acyl-coenzyme A synthetase/AMP-(fatty) acid ligase